MFKDSFLDERNRKKGNINPDPFATQLFCRCYCRSTTTEGVKHDISFIG